MRTVQLAYNARLIRKAKTYTEYLSKLKSIAGLRDFKFQSREIRRLAGKIREHARPLQLNYLSS